MLGQTQSRIFLNIAEGKIVKRVDQRVEVYDYLEGDLERIYPKERVFRGETVPYWYLDMRDPQSGDLYSLGIRATSGVWRSLILSLGSIDNFLLPIRINPYRKGDYDRVSVYSDGKRVDWVSDLPPVEEIEVQGQRVKSTAKRDQFISRLVDQVNTRLGANTASPETPVSTSTQRRTRRSGSSVSLSSLMENLNNSH